MKRLLCSLLFAASLLSGEPLSAATVVPSSIDQPGTQPQEISNLDTPDKCDNCHDVSNPAVGNLAHNYGAQAAFLPTETVIADGSPNEAPKNFANKAAFNNPP